MKVPPTISVEPVFKDLSLLYRSHFKQNEKHKSAHVAGQLKTREYAFVPSLGGWLPLTGRRRAHPVAAKALWKVEEMTPATPRRILAKGDIFLLSQEEARLRIPCVSRS